MKNKTLKEFSELLASKEPTPGGGGAMAYAGSLSASLANMVVNLTVGKKKYLEYTNELNDLKRELDSLREKLNDDINKDALAFEPLAKVYKMDKDSLEYEKLLEECLIVAAKSPMSIFETTIRIIEIDERLAIIGSLVSVSDAATSVMLAYGTLYGSYINIKANTRLFKNREKAHEIENKYENLLDEYSNRAMTCYKMIEKRLNHD